MATEALAAIGTLLKVGDGAASEAFTTLAEVTNISGPALGLDMVDVTNHSSPNYTEEKIPTIKRLGDVTLDISYVPTQATHNATTGLINDWENRTKRNFQIVTPDSTTLAFAAYVSGFEPSYPVDGKIAASVTLSVTSITPV